MTILTAGGASYKEIETAVRGESFEEIHTIISADGGMKSDTGALCLMVASLWNKQAIAEKLLTAGVSPNASPRYAREAGETPLTYAIFGAQENMVAFLLGRGANANYRGDCGVRNCRGRMPLDLATKCGLLHIARRLLEAGADPNAGQSFAMETANQQGDVKLFQLLLAHGGHLPPGPAISHRDDVQSGSKAGPDASAFNTLGLAQLLPPAPGGPVPWRAKARCRLAVIAEDDTLTAADVLVARLTAQPTLELIERQELERVFAEKKLTRQFAAQEANYNSVAEFLRADALLLICIRDISGTRAVEARFIRVHPGIVLDTVYRATPLTDVKTWAEEMSARVAGLAGKAVCAEAISLSMLDVHAALPTPTTVALEQTLSVLLRDRLIHHPKFVVLERSQMEKVAFENAGEKPFWAGSYLVDPLVEAAVDNTGSFTLTVRFQPSARGATISATVEGQRSEPARAIDELLQRLDQQMAGLTVAPTRRAVAGEADSYFEEARWALAAKMPARAHAAAEVAWALGRQNLEMAKLRFHCAQDAVRDAVSRRQTPNAAPAAEPLEFAMQAVGVWDDVLQSGMLRQHPAELRTWLESLPDVANATTLAIIAVGSATEQIKQSERLAILRKMYATTLRDALTRSGELPSDCDLPARISRIQLETARMVLPDEAELRATLQEILSRHFTTNDAASRAALRLGIRWLPSMHKTIETYGSSVQLGYWYPNNERVKEWLLDSFRKSSAPEERFLASAIDSDGWVILPVERSTRLMEEFWAMRDQVLQDGELFKLYFARLHNLIENEPITGESYVPRTYRLKLAQDESAERQSIEMTRFEYYRRLYLYLIHHAGRPQPAFDDLVRRYLSRYSAEQKNELREACARYALRTGAPPAEFFSATPGVRLVARPPAPPDALPPLRINLFWHPFELGRDISPDFEFQIGSMLWAEDRLWFGGSVREFDSKPQVVRHYLFAVEPMTMATKTIELPLIPVKPQAPGPVVPHGVRFAVRPECLVVTAAHDFFALYDRNARRWQIYPEIQPARVERPEIIGDAAYLIVEDGNAVLRFDLLRHTATVLASTRRKPPDGPLDDPALWFSQIWKNDAGELAVLAQSDHEVYLKLQNLVQAWSPQSQTWRHIEGPVRTLKTKLPNTTYGRVAAGSYLALPGLEIVGNATAEGRARGSGLELRLRNQVKPFDKIPLLVMPKSPLRLPDNRYGPQNVGFRVCYECPAGYVFPPSPGAGFWFLPRSEFADYVSLAGGPAGTAPNGATATAVLDQRIGGQP